jgi:hypothetical protein
MNYIVIALVLIIATIVVYLVTRSQKDNFSMLTMDTMGDLSVDNQIIETDNVGVTSIKTGGSGLTIDGDLTVDGGINLPLDAKICFGGVTPCFDVDRYDRGPKNTATF